MPVQKWWLLLTDFFSIFLNIVYGWTAQKSAINSKNFVQKIFFQLLCRLYKTPKFGGNVLYECPSINYVPSEFCSFIHHVLPSLHGYPFAYAFFYPPIPKNNLRKLFCFVSYLRKNLSLTFLVSKSHVRAHKPGWQFVKHNVCGWTYFEHLLGQFFLPWVNLKLSSKMCGHRDFSKYLSNNCRTPSNHHNNYAKILLCSIILHSYFQSQSLLERFFKWS